jgi:hypothetical protein
MEMAVWYIRERFRVNGAVVRESLKSSVSCGLGLEEIGRTSCVRESVEVVRVLEFQKSC